MTRPRVLFLTCHLPYPPISGGRLREHELLTRVAGDFDVHFCVVSKTYEQDVDNSGALLPYCADISVFAASPIPPLADWEADTPFQVMRHRSAEATDHIASIAGAFDMIHVEGFYLMQHLPPSQVPVLLVEQNVEYILWRQRTATCEGHQRREYLHEYLKTLDAEMNAWKMATLCATVTEDDRSIMLSAMPGLDVRVIPDGCDHLARRPEPLGARSPNGEDVPHPSLLYVANFGYQPNVDGALHLCEDVFPRIKFRVPRARLLLVGDSPPPELLEAAERMQGVIVTGRVPSVLPYLDASDVVVCPLRIGGGVKVKMLEALSRGKAIVTTSVGVQGLGSGVREAVALHDEPARFAHAAAALLHRPAERRLLEERALRFAAGLPTWGEAAKALVDTYLELTSHHSQRVEVAESLKPRESSAESTSGPSRSATLQDPQVGLDV